MIVRVVEHTLGGTSAFGSAGPALWSLVGSGGGADRADTRNEHARRRVVEVAGRFEWGRPKTEKSSRTVYLPDLVIAPMAEHLLRFPPLRDEEDPNLEGLVFYGEKGGPVRRHVFRSAWQKACSGADVAGVRPEWLRHTGASLAYAATKDMKAVAARLGHTSTRMMDTTYVELYEDSSRAVADAIDVLVKAASAAE